MWQNDAVDQSLCPDCPTVSCNVAAACVDTQLNPSATESDRDGASEGVLPVRVAGLRDTMRGLPAASPLAVVNAVVAASLTAEVKGHPGAAAMIALLEVHGWDGCGFHSAFSLRELQKDLAFPGVGEALPPQVALKVRLTWHCVNAVQQMLAHLY